MKTYAIKAVVKVAGTYDEYDGFGDYPTYKTCFAGEVGANSPEEALKNYGFKDSWDISYFAEERVA
jgi:hypothetical protein